jgi:SAM-dependent methyltransferase
METAAAFMEKVADALRSRRWVSILLSKPKARDADVRNIQIRPHDARGEAVASWHWRFTTRDEVKHLATQATLAKLEAMLGTQFAHAELTTPTHVTTLTYNRRGEAATSARTVAKSGGVAPMPHDRPKHRLLESGASWCHALGLTDGHGNVLPSAQDKWCQIHRFIESMAALLRAADLPAEATIADLGCGKGYLTFALAQYCRDQGMAVRVVGVERREPLVALCNQVAVEHGCANVRFATGDLASWQPSALDVLIALHACDTATDLALAHAVKARAKIAVVAPCCHQQVRNDLQVPPSLSALLRDGLMLARQADLLTDSLRALIMEAHGYKARVFEFISSEHTAKNLMLTAELVPLSRARQEKAAAEVRDVMAHFGVRRHALWDLLEA